MRRSLACVVVVGVLGGLTVSPSAVRAGVWVTLAAGLPGSETPTSDSEFWFDTPHGPPLVALDQLAGGTTAQATTGGGTVFFGGNATPVLLNLADGSAYVAGGSPPAAATAGGPNGGSAGTPASAAPAAGGTVPSGASLLGVTLAAPDAAGARGLTAVVTDPNGTALGTATVTVPDGGWWVLGLTPGDKTPSDPVGTPPPTDGGTATPPPTGGGTDTTTPPPVSRPDSGDGSVATPEPTTLALVTAGGIGGIAARMWRRPRLRTRAAAL